MKINCLNGVAFTGKIIDTHTHMGTWRGAWGGTVSFNEGAFDEFTKSPLDIVVGGVKQQDTIEKFIVSNLNCITDNGTVADEIVGNKEMLDFCDKNPKFFPLAVCQPSKTDGNAKHISKLFKENPNKFIGLKFHPRSLELAADHENYRPYFRVAEKYQIPCLFHSDAAFDEAGKLVDEIASPKAIYESAREFPNVPVVMGHMGAGGVKAHNSAIEVLLSSIDKKDAKLFVDLSWVDWGNDGLSSENKPSVVRLIQELKKRNAMDRVLFGTDAPLGCYGEAPVSGKTPKAAYEKTVQDLKNVIKKNFGADADSIIDKIFYKNADDLYFNKTWNNIVDEVKGGPSVKKVIGIGLLCLAAVTGLKYLIDGRKPIEKK